MKPKHALAALLSTAAVTGGVLLASEVQASPCPFLKNASHSSQNVTALHMKMPLKAAIFGGAALVTGAGIFAVRRIADARRASRPEFSSTEELMTAN